MTAKSMVFTAAAAVILGAVSMFAGSSIAAAAPPGFPDVNAFSPVDPSSHTVGNPRSSEIEFVAPDGVSCSWGFSTEPNDREAVLCEGNIPGIPASAPDDGNSGCGQVHVVGYPNSRTGPYVISRHGGSCGPFSGFPPLGVGQKLSATNITCVVGANDLTACIDSSDGHGFLFEPSGSSAF
jgi:hypothetical protein